MVLLGIALSDATVAQVPDPPSADQLAIQWGVETNLVDDGARFRSRLTLSNEGATALPASGWSLYFNFLRQIDSESVSAPVEITRVNGDFYKLEPGDDFASVAPGEQFEVTFETPGTAIKPIDAPAGFYVVFAGPDGEPGPPAPVTNVTVEPFTRPEQTTRAPNDVWPVPTPATRYDTRTTRP